MRVLSALMVAASLVMALALLGTGCKDKNRTPEVTIEEPPPGVEVTPPGNAPKTLSKPN